MPPAAVSFIGVTIAVCFQLVGNSSQEAMEWGLSGFSNKTVWLIFSAFILSTGYEKSGLGRRLALLLVSRLGKSSLGLGYAVTLADLLLSPVTPSNTARSAGTIYPIVRNIPPLFDSAPGETRRRMGAYIMWTGFSATAITSSIFLTALAPNLLAIAFIDQIVGVQIGWIQWFVGFLPCGIFLLLVVPYLIYKVYPPEVKESREISYWAQNQLTEMGALKTSEWRMGGMIFIALLFWIFGRDFIHSTSVAWLVVCLMIVFKILSWEDLIRNRSAWNALIWFGTLVSLANGLKITGLIDWIARESTSSLKMLSPILVMVLLVSIFYLLHYVFASLTAHTTALFPLFLGIGLSIPDMPMIPFSLSLAYTLGLMGILTPYATGPAPVFYGSGFISTREFWGLGLLFGFLFLMIVLLGIPYLLWIY